MKAIISHGKGAVSLENIPIPSIGSKDLLLKVFSAPICGTDNRIIKNGHFKIPEGERRVLGHEVGGEVVEVGKDIKRYKVGDRLSMAPNIGCGYCRECISGNTQLCRDYEAIGVTLNGAFAEYIKIPYQFIEQGNVYAFPSEITFEEASLAEMLATVLSGAESCRINYADIVLIIGAGPIGITHTMLAKISGTQKIIVSEVSEERRMQALEFGADFVINPTDADFKDKLMSLSYGRGPDVIIIAAPSSSAQEDSIKLVARNGRINFFGGLPKGAEDIKINSNLIHYNLITITGTTGSNVLQYRKAVELIISQKIRMSKIVSKRHAFEDFKQAFEDATSGKFLKIIFKL